MQIIRTFELSNEKLFSVLYDIHTNQFDEDGELLDDFKCCEFSRLFDFFTDADKLRTFFENNIDDLNHPFWQKMTIEDAIIKVRKEAINLKKTLLKYSQDSEYSLGSLFKPLSGTSNLEFGKTKYRLQGTSKAMLRIYAIKVKDAYIICGGAIKLREKMNGSEYLENELYKMSIAQNWFKKKYDFDVDEFYEL